MSLSGFRMFRGAAVLAALFASPVHAANVFYDDFAYGADTKLNATSADFGGNWQISDGSVDLLASTSDYGSLCSGFANCVDLDGSTNNAGVFSTTQVFAPGRYTLAFAMSGNKRGAGDDTVTISLGSFSYTFTIGQDDFVYGGSSQFGTVFKNFVTTTAGSLSFADAGADNQGAILKNVYLDTAAVPIPAAGGLLLAALGGLAFLRRKRV